MPKRRDYLKNFPIKTAVHGLLVRPFEAGDLSQLVESLQEMEPHGALVPSGFNENRAQDVINQRLFLNGKRRFVRWGIFCPMADRLGDVVYKRGDLAGDFFACAVPEEKGSKNRWQIRDFMRPKFLGVGLTQEVLQDAAFPVLRQMFGADTFFAETSASSAEFVRALQDVGFERDKSQRHRLQRSFYLR